MAVSISIDRGRGAIIIGAERLEPWEGRASIEPRIAAVLLPPTPYADEQERLRLHNLSLRGWDASATLGFVDGRLEQLDLAVSIPPSSGDGAWPSDIDLRAEVGTVRHALAMMIGSQEPHGTWSFPWGDVWSGVQPGESMPSHGLRYRPHVEEGEQRSGEPADLLAAFPDRPLGLTRRAGSSLTKGLLGLSGIALLVALVFGWQLLGQLSLRSDLRERGVQTRMLSWDGSCSRRYGNTLCSGTARYAVRPEHGGGVQAAKVYMYSYQTGFAGSLPPVIYDPQQPDHVLTPEDLEAGAGDGYYAGTFISLGLSLLMAGLAFLDARRRRRLANARGRPVLVPLSDVSEKPAGCFVLVFAHPTSGRIREFAFPEGMRPFLVTRGPPGEAGPAHMVALATPGGDIQPLDGDLTFLDLSNEEREAILHAATS